MSQFSETEFIRGVDKRAASELAAKRIILEIQEALVRRDDAHVSVAWCGGSSPSDILSTLVEEFPKIPEHARKKIHFLLIDERRVPIGDPESNFHMLNEKLFSPLLEKKLLDRSQVHPFPVELAPEEAAKEYSHFVEKELKGIDIVILGVGPDGHVAAIFPNHQSVCSEELGYLYVSDRPKPPTQGFTASRLLLESCHTGFLLFFGSEKEEPLRNYLNGEDVIQVPARVGRSMRRNIVVTNIAVS